MYPTFAPPPHAVAAVFSQADRLQPTAVGVQNRRRLVLKTDGNRQSTDASSLSTERQLVAKADGSSRTARAPLRSRRTKLRSGFAFIGMRARRGCALVPRLRPQDSEFLKARHQFKAEPPAITDRLLWMSPPNKFLTGKHARPDVVKSIDQWLQISDDPRPPEPRGPGIHVQHGELLELLMERGTPSPPDRKEGLPPLSTPPR